MRVVVLSKVRAFSRRHEDYLAILSKYSLFISQLYMTPAELRWTAMATEIENLRAKTETLNEELRTEEQKEKSLQEEIEILEAKIVIRFLEKELDTKTESIGQLEWRKGELQEKYNQPVQDAKKDKESKEFSEIVVAAEPVCNPEPVESAEQTQRKRRFF
jgi:chromosome segregation ATPase